MSEIGILCENRDGLRERCQVPLGLTVLKPTEAEQKGYYASDIPRVIVPATMPRPATDEELDAIIAGPETKRLMQLCRLPRYIGERLLKGCMDNGLDAFDENTPYQEIAPSISGHCLSSRFDDADQLTVSVNLRDINRLNGLPSKVGLHMDTYENPDLSLLIGNIGPGEHWHNLVPEFNRDVAGGPSRADRMRFLEAHPDPSSIPVYWFKLRPPDKDSIEVLLNAPVAWAMHDGSTLGFPEPSTAFFCAIDPIPMRAYPSPLLG
jgi:hypothetical protein